MFWYRFFKFTIFHPLVKYGWGAVVIGSENYPREGGLIMASNHIGALDSLIIPAMLPRPLTFPAKAELFASGGGAGARIVAWFLKTIKMVPMDRSGGRASADALQAISDVLAEGRVVGIYPEGTRSPDGRLSRGKTGVARIALATGAPVIPVAMIGSDLAQPIGQAIPSTRHRVGIVVGEPLDFTRYKGLENDRFVLRSITDEIMYEIMRLGGQEYVDMYASKAKELARKQAAEAAEAARRAKADAAETARDTEGAGEAADESRRAS